MSVDASLDSLRAMVGAQSTRDDALLAQALQTAAEHIAAMVYPESWNTSPVQQAVLLTAARLYRRRQSPEGVTGIGAEGFVVRILSRDPDVQALLERHMDMTKVGIG